MSITNLIRTLTATSVDGFPLLLPSLVDTVITLVLGEEASEQTAAITSCTSAGFNRRGCCSLISKRDRFVRCKMTNTNISIIKNYSTIKKVARYFIINKGCNKNQSIINRYVDRYFILGTTLRKLVSFRIMRSFV